MYILHGNDKKKGFASVHTNIYIKQFVKLKKEVKNFSDWKIKKNKNKPNMNWYIMGEKKERKQNRVGSCLACYLLLHSFKNLK